MVVINYITNLDVKEFSGGWSGMNHNVYNQLAAEFNVHLVQKVNPPYSSAERLVSKGLRILGLKGSFPAFTRRRLEKIQQLVEERLKQQAHINFYHGATPWLLIRNKRPYAIYLDCCFSSYIRVYHDSKKFSSRQLNYLFRKERDFLQNALCVFFSSKWALQDAVLSYKLSGDNFYVAGLGGGLQLNEVKRSINDKYFLFVSLDFFGKGGDELAEAFMEIRKEYPDYKLRIVGERPPEKYLSYTNLEYFGRLDKSVDSERQKLESLFLNAFCFVLPTSKDMTPLVLVEASSVGCPVIATNSFGIPEIIKDKETGLLVKSTKPMKDQLVAAMKEMIQNKDFIQVLKVKSQEHIQSNFTWAKTGQIIRTKIKEGLT